MKQFRSIPIYPLRMRGRFGLTRHIYRHGFLSAFFYTLLYAFFVLLLMSLSLAPAVSRLWNSELFTRLAQGLKELVRLPFPALSGEYFWSFDLPNSFTELGGAAIIFNLLATLGIGFLSVAFFYFFLKPRYLGVMYTEMSGRIFGVAGNLSDICKRGRPCFKRYYSTYLAHMLGMLGAKAACSLSAQILRLMLGALAFAASVFSVLSGGLLGMCILVLTVFLNLTVEALFSLTFPVAVNENCRDFSALGRSIRLVWHNFWRFIWALLLRALYVGLWSLPGWILLCIGLFKGSYHLAILLCGLVWLLVVRLYFIPFKIAFNTVLYQDALVRESGTPINAEEHNAPDEAAQETKRTPDAEAPADEAHTDEAPDEAQQVILLPSSEEAEEDESMPSPDENANPSDDEIKE